MAVSGQRTRWLAAARPQRVARSLVVPALLLLPVLSPAKATAETLPNKESFESRFAAVEASDPSPDAQAAAAAKEQEKNSDNPPASEASPQRPSDPRAYYRMLVEKEAGRAGLAPEIAEAVLAVESGYNPAAIGGVGEIGLMQLLPSTARMLGFSGSLSDLAVPETNIHYGVTYLAAAWRLAGGDLCTAVMKYRAGHGETRFSYLSVNYCVAVRGRLAARGFRVTGTVPVATFGEAARSGGGGCGHKCLGAGGRIGRVDLAALNTRLNALVIQVRAGR